MEWNITKGELVRGTDDLTLVNSSWRYHIIFCILCYRPFYWNTLKVFGGVFEEDRLLGGHRLSLTSRFVVNYILLCGGVKCQRFRLCILYYKLYIFFKIYSHGFFHRIQRCVESLTVSLFNNAFAIIYLCVFNVYNIIYLYFTDRPWTRERQ